MKNQTVRKIIVTSILSGAMIATMIGPSMAKSMREAVAEEAAPEYSSLTLDANNGSGETKTASDAGIAINAGVIPDAYEGVTSWNTAADGSGTSYGVHDQLPTAANGQPTVLYAMYGNTSSAPVAEAVQEITTQVTTQVEQQIAAQPVAEVPAGQPAQITIGDVQVPVATTTDPTTGKTVADLSAIKVASSAVARNYAQFLALVEYQAKTAAPNGIIAIDMGKWASIDRKAAEAITASGNTAIFFFNHGGQNFQVTVPAGYDLKPLVNAEGYLGMLYLAQNVGATPIQ